jgi:hypothetical protein
MVNSQGGTAISSDWGRTSYKEEGRDVVPQLQSEYQQSYTTVYCSGVLHCGIVMPNSRLRLTLALLLFIGIDTVLILTW